VSEGDLHAGVALLFLAAFVLIVVAATALVAGSLSAGGLRLPVVALVASLGGFLLLWLGVVRCSASPPSAS
jgi:hypothetical protein